MWNMSKSPIRKLQVNMRRGVINRLKQCTDVPGTPQDRLRIGDFGISKAWSVDGSLLASWDSMDSMALIPPGAPGPGKHVCLCQDHHRHTLLSES